MAPATKSRAKRTTHSSPTPPAPPATRTTYMLRSCSADLTSRGGAFQYPASGVVSCPDWDPRPRCGNGLHGLLHGEGNYSLMDWSVEAKWLVIAVDADAVVKIDSEKVKVPRGEVVFVGSPSEAVAKLAELDAEADRIKLPFYQASASGYSGQASASGYSGQASASGPRGQASASGYSGQASASGYSGQASASGYSGQASASGPRGQASAKRGRARAGELGILILFHFDEAAQRDRVVVGYVGENGIEAGKWYKLDGDRIVESPETDYAFDAFRAAPFECAKDAAGLRLEISAVTS